MTTTKTAQTKKAAIAKVPSHVSPKACFVWFMDKHRGWEPIPGTGCAHYVAHEIGLNTATYGRNGCLNGYHIRVPDLVRSLREIKPAEVKKGDVWANASKDHTGIVSEVARKDKKVVSVTIKHSSSRQHRIAEDDWKTHFQGGGTFYRK